jgi:hypothetical protein
MMDYLLLQVMMGSGQRCGAASNLTIYEFSNGVWTETEGKQQVYITRTLQHKMSSGGPAKLLWDEQLKQFADSYLLKLRCLFANKNSVAPQTVGIHAISLFFISSKGNPLNESKASNRLVHMGKQVAPELKGTLKSSRLRKSIVSMQREQSNSAVSGTQLAKQMGHSLATAEKYYQIETEAESDARVATLIERIPQGDSPPQVDVWAAPEISEEPPTTSKEDKEDGEEQKEDDQSEHSKDSKMLVDTLNLAQRHELLSLFADNLKSERAVMRHFVQVRMSRNSILKGGDPDVAVEYLQRKKASELSGVQKASAWVKLSNFNEINLYAASSSGTSGRLFTGLQTTNNNNKIYFSTHHNYNI